MQRPGTTARTSTNNTARSLRAAILLCLAVAATAWIAWTPYVDRLWAELHQRAPQELIRYSLRRLEGHSKLEWVLVPILRVGQRAFEREPPSRLPTLNKGQQPTSLPRFGHTVHNVYVDTPQGIREALLRASEGTAITISPGLYLFSDKLRLGHPGTDDHPIVMRSATPGTVELEFTHADGILVNKPNWIFENLNIRGACSHHDDCDHAFHIVGGGEKVTIQNTRITDFNAHIKVNGDINGWPDRGRLVHNTLSNSTPRRTTRPVALFDLVGADHWLIEDNLIQNFSKLDGNQVAYGMFVKGAGESASFERNLIICSSKDISTAGIRVGLSFGGGETGSKYCRRHGCENFEYRNSQAINNIIAHCNDLGIDINRSVEIQLLHNTVINTSGIGSRNPASQARLTANLIDGGIYARDGSRLLLEGGGSVTARDSLVSADYLDVSPLPSLSPHPRSSLVTKDFFLRPRSDMTAPGAVEFTPPAASQ